MENTSIAQGLPFMPHKVDSVMFADHEMFTIALSVAHEAPIIVPSLNTPKIAGTK